MGEQTQGWFKKVVNAAQGVFKADAATATRVADQIANVRMAVAEGAESVRPQAWEKMLQGTVGDAEKNYRSGMGLWGAAESMAESKGFERAVGAADWLTGSGKGAGVAAGRIGAVWGGLTAVGTGYRYASGGTLTQNNKGESDIVGLPF